MAILLLLLNGLNLSQCQGIKDCILNEAINFHFLFIECSNPSCGIALSIRDQCFLNSICDYCEAIYKNNEVRIQCRKDCFQTPVFQYCLNTTIMTEEDEETAAQANDILVGINGGNIFGKEFQS